MIGLSIGPGQTRVFVERRQQWLLSCSRSLSHATHVVPLLLLLRWLLCLRLMYISILKKRLRGLRILKDMT